MKTSSLSFDAANKPTFLHLYRLEHQILHAIRASRTNRREKESKSVKSHSSKKQVPLVQRTIWQPAFKRQTHKVFMRAPAVQWVQTATEEFIKGGERIIKCIRFKPRPNKKRLSLKHCRKESKLSSVMTLRIQKKNNMFRRQKTTDSDFITVALGCSREKGCKVLKNCASAGRSNRLRGDERWTCSNAHVSYLFPIFVDGAVLVEERFHLYMSGFAFPPVQS